MIRLAAFLLRTIAGTVEYRVQRLRAGKDGTFSNKDGTTLLRTESFSEAKAKLKKARVGDDQLLVIRLVAKVALRKANVTIVGKELHIDGDADEVNDAPDSQPIDPIPDMDSDETPTPQQEKEDA